MEKWSLLKDGRRGSFVNIVREKEKNAKGDILKKRHERQRVLASQFIISTFKQEKEINIYPFSLK